MSDIVGQLADLTALRDRSSLDTALATTLHDLLHPERIVILRRVGPGGDERWLTCADVVHGVVDTSPTTAWADLEQLPAADQFPTRQRVLAERVHALASSNQQPHVFPLISANGASTVMELFFDQALTDEQVRLIDGVLRLYQNFQNLLDYGERDALTELLNRKTFDGAFMEATVSQRPMADAVLTDANERRQPVTSQDTSTSSAGYWLAMIDIDHFKHVNDNYGHLIGDEVLVLLARLMRQTFRIHDQLYRFGGEEFVVLMRCTSPQQAAQALERLRVVTEAYRFSQVGHISISVGFTEVHHGDSPSGAIERADKAVYYAKEHGRNQVFSFEELLACGKLASEPENRGDIELF